MIVFTVSHSEEDFDSDLNHIERLLVTLKGSVQGKHSQMFSWLNGSSQVKKSR